jgi:hypothetical protein
MSAESLSVSLGSAYFDCVATAGLDSDDTEDELASAFPQAVHAEALSHPMRSSARRELRFDRTSMNFVLSRRTGVCIRGSMKVSWVIRKHPPDIADITKCILTL